MRRRRKDAADATVAAVAQLYHKGTRPPEISERIGCDPSTVYRALKLAGITLNRTPQRIEVDGKAIAKLYEAGASVRKAAAACGTSRKVAAHRLGEQGVTIRPHGVKVPSAELVERYSAGESQKALARRYRVGEATIALRLNKAGIARRNVKEAIASARRQKEAMQKAERTTVCDQPGGKHGADEGERSDTGRPTPNKTPKPMEGSERTKWEDAALKSLEVTSLAPDRVGRRIVVLQERIVAQRKAIEKRAKEHSGTAEPRRASRGGQWGNNPLTAVEVAVRAPLALAERVAGLGRDMIEKREQSRIETAAGPVP